MDGFQFLEEFEKFSPDLKSKIKIVVLSCSLNPSDVERAKEYERVVYYCHKPLSAIDLTDLLKE